MPRRYQTVPEFWRDEKEHLRKLSQTVNELLKGRSNANFEVLLGANTMETVFESDLVGAQTTPYLTPLDAPVSDFWFDVAPPEITIHHDLAPVSRRVGLLLVS